jgi:ssRNA-specific RNase YbeY (16S rRNA maturation enzyme)
LKEQREVSSEEAERFANFNEMPFVETSAKTGKSNLNHIQYVVIHSIL